MLEDSMLQNSNMLHPLGEAQHSLEQIMESARDSPAVSRVKSDKNAGACRKVAGGVWGIRNT
jgi:hypothetical protein